MKKHIMWAAGLLSLLVAGCSCEELTEKENPVDNKIITIQANIEQEGDTRLTYDDQGAGVGMKMAWSVDEEFMMYNGTESSGEKFTKSAAGNSFSGTVPTGTDKKYAIYENNCTYTKTESDLALDISKQVGTAEEKGITELMIAEPTDFSQPFEFKHQLALLKLELTFPKEVTGTVEEVAISGLHNKATYTLSTSTSTGIFTYTDAGKDDIVATNGTTGFTIADQKITAYVAVFPEAEVPAKSVTIKATVGTDEYFYTLQSAKSLIKAALLTPITANVSKTVTNGYEFVDLGLPTGTKWATMNVGASRPEEFGDWYAWGDMKTGTKYSYSWANYLDAGMTAKTDCGTSKDPLQDYVYPNSRSIAGTKFDVAHVKWGGSCKMPTKEQFEELLAETDRSKTTQDGVSGWKFTSKKDSTKSIFLPYAGYRDGNATSNGSFTYWSASPTTNKYVYSAYYFQYNATVGYLKMNTALRNIGRPIRPVSK